MSENGQGGFNFQDAEITLGSSKIEATINSKSLADDIVITVPITIKASMMMMNKDINFEIEMQVKQHYVFNYA